MATTDGPHPGKIERIEGNFMTQPNKDFPLDCETLNALQNLSRLAALAGNLGGDKVILCGCSKVGTQYMPGYVFLRTKSHPEGEIMRWEGGPVSSGVYVRTEAVKVVANNINYDRAYYKRSLAPGVGSETYRWEEFHGVPTLGELNESITKLAGRIESERERPAGIVEIWAGNAVPEGYVLCNGQELKQTDYPKLYAALGTTYNTAPSASGQRYTTSAGYFRVPDLRGRFVVGLHDSDSDYGRTGNAGGLKTVTLEEAQMPRHKHTQQLWSQGSGQWKGGGNDSSPNSTTDYGTSDTTRETLSAGDGEAHENRPPFYTLAYIIKAN